MRSVCWGSWSPVASSSISKVEGTPGRMVILELASSRRTCREVQAAMKVDAASGPEGSEQAMFEAVGMGEGDGHQDAVGRGEADRLGHGLGDGTEGLWTTADDLGKPGGAGTLEEKIAWR